MLLALPLSSTCNQYVPCKPPGIEMEPEPLPLTVATVGGLFDCPARRTCEFPGKSAYENVTVDAVALVTLIEGPVISRVSDVKIFPVFASATLTVYVPFGKYGMGPPKPATSE